MQAVADAIAASHGPVEVLGDSTFARQLRVRLGAGAVAIGVRPAVVVETSGDATSLGAALERVADLGTVVLASPGGARDPLESTAALDLYADLHVRGLTIVGVPPPCGTEMPAP